MNRIYPLDNFPLIRTRKIENLREAFAQVYIKPELELRDRSKTLDARYNSCRLAQVGVSYITYGTAVRLRFAEADYHLQFFPLRGKGGIAVNKITVPLTLNCGATISSNMSHEPIYCAGYEQLVLRINSTALTKKLAAITGATINAPLRMHPVPNFDRPAAQSLRRYFRLLVNELGSVATPIPTWVQTQVEQLLMVMFLYANEHNYSRLLEERPRDLALRQVHRAEEYIEANSNRPIILEDLAAVTGANTLSLFHSFKQSRGYSPLEFARRVRRSQKKGEHS